ncbi:YveK family protein [Bacillus massiliigorillae]|uniref:YveK family protein n=1 Tax=Bacillus massiliigorillae TaxID=1243664 RepID=UPI0003A9A3BF|nr:Wzz/FepE/Etk N-terminal domain-containing protein [Bacillus massiliigorillae]
MEETVNIKDLLFICKKQLPLIIGITVLSVVICAFITYFLLTPIYKGSTQLLINKSKDNEAVYEYNEVQTNLQLINTYNVIIKSPRILNLVKEELGLQLSIEELTKKITVESEEDSQVLNINVEDPNPEVAAEIANTIAKVFQKNIVEIMNIDNVVILAQATVNQNPVPIKPNPLLNLAISVVIGLMIGFGIAFFLEYLDNSIKTEQDIENMFDLPVLGVISTIETNAHEKYETEGRNSECLISKRKKVL